MRPRLVLFGLTACVVLAGCTSSNTGTPQQPRNDSSPAPTTSPVTSTAPVATPTSPRPSPTPSPSVPPLGAAARAADLVDIRTVVPDAILDLRYATADNFTHVQLYPTNARCMVHESMVHGLTVAAARLRSDGYRLVFWDCYRPHAVQVQMFRIVPNPEWVARPGNYATSHESARSVDVTLAVVHATCAAADKVRGYCLLDMGTGFDDVTSRAHAFATTGVTATQQAHRGILRHAMEAGGLSVYSGEWWHFDGAGSKVHRPILDVPVTG